MTTLAAASPVTTPETTPVTTPGTLPDGDALGNDILASAGTAETKALLRKTAGGGTSRKARKSNEPPRVMFSPQAWSISGRVD